MKLKTKEEYINDLKKDPLFNLVLNSSTDEKERKMIEDVATAFLSRSLDSLLSIGNVAKQNPDLAKRAEQARNKNDSEKKIDETLITIDSNKK